MNLQDIVYPIAEITEWTFDNVLVPIGELPTAINPNYLFLGLGFIGLFVWLNMQKKYNQAANSADQLK